MRTSGLDSERFIVDNSDRGWPVQRYLRDWCGLSRGIDIASGYFEIGALLALDGQWQQVDRLRILMGDEVSLRTAGAFEASLARAVARLDASLEAEKLNDDFLTGVHAMVDAMREGEIACRVYREDKFHAKAYITHVREEGVGSSALVGSSNFTLPGITQNVELNVRIVGAPVRALQAWYEEHWNAAEDVTPEILRTIERHVREYPPFDIYARSLHALLQGEELTVGEWERNESVMFPRLAQYQQDAYGALLKRGAEYGGAFLCDGVGLGKTYVGLALLERLVEHDRKRVALFVPKAAAESVWRSRLKRYLPDLIHGGEGFKLFNHTDLLRGGEIEESLDYVRRKYDVVMIDEAHHFRNKGIRGEEGGRRKSRYWAMHDLCEGKQVYLLTATPVNNRLLDLQHMIELFARDDSRHFKRLGIHSLTGHIKKMEKELEDAVRDTQAAMGDTHADAAPSPAPTDAVEADAVLADDVLFRELVVQRSRGYIKESLKASEAGDVIFPTREPPRVADYGLRKTYGRLLDMVEQAFHKENPLFSLPIYFPWEKYYLGDPSELDAWVTGRQKQIVQLIRTGFLKRFESSARAFETSCWRLLQKLMAWTHVHADTPDERRHFEKWKLRHKDLLGYEQDRQFELFGDADDPDAQDDDILPPELIDAVEIRSRDLFDVPAILADTRDDMDNLVKFLEELRRLDPRQDDKLQALLRLLKDDPVLSRHKVLIFTEFADTARYLERELKEAGIRGVAEIDSNRASADARGDLIRRFAPYYNGTDSRSLASRGEPEIRVLISTDVLSEGLNLQDATRLINYDLHWNPVRLMQRIGRVDRRLDPGVEALILHHHPDQADVRGGVVYWNFLPPDELNRLLSLYQRVTHKVLRISETLGIEGGRLLTPEQRLNALRIFDEKYEGRKSPIELMRLELEGLLRDDPTLQARLAALPDRVFSGKAHPRPDARGVFFCYALPGRDEARSQTIGHDHWSLDAGRVQWLLYDLTTGDILDDRDRIHDLIRCPPEEPRRSAATRDTLAQARRGVERHLRDTYLKSVQAPPTLKPKLLAWMELT